MDLCRVEHKRTSTLRCNHQNVWLQIPERCRFLSGELHLYSFSVPVLLREILEPARITWRYILNPIFRGDFPDPIIMRCPLPWPCTSFVTWQMFPRCRHHGSAVYCFTMAGTLRLKTIPQFCSLWYLSFSFRGTSAENGCIFLVILRPMKN